METVSARGVGGKHRQAEGEAGSVPPVDERGELDDLPTETLPRAVDPAEPRTEVIDSEAVQAGPHRAAQAGDGPVEPPAADRPEPSGSAEGPPVAGAAGDPVAGGPPVAAESDAEEAGHRADDAGHRADDAGHRADEAGHSGGEAGHSGGEAGYRGGEAGHRGGEAGRTGGDAGQRDGEVGERAGEAAAPAPQPLPAADHDAAGAEPAAGGGDVPPPAVAAPRAGRGGRGGRIAAAVVALVAIGLVAWLVVTLVRAAGEPPAPADTGPVTAAPAGFGEEIAGPDRWAVAISMPEGADTTGELPAGAARAVRLEVTLTNDATEPRDTRGWTVKATADGRAVELLPTDGRSSTDVPSRTVLPGSPLRFAVEVPMPSDEAELQLEAVLAGSPPVLFVGPA